jgi:hypothetical protein
MSTAQLSFNTSSNSDLIDTLPTDQTMPSHAEIQIVDTLFKQNSTVQKLLSGTQDVLVVGLLFLLFSLPQIDMMIKKFVSSSNNSEYILLGIKCLLFMLVYFLVKNMYLAKKQK